jgi:hypothetical protein
LQRGHRLGLDSGAGGRGGGEPGRGRQVVEEIYQAEQVGSVEGGGPSRGEGARVGGGIVWNGEANGSVKDVSQALEVVAGFEGVVQCLVLSRLDPFGCRGAVFGEQG